MTDNAMAMRELRQTWRNLGFINKSFFIPEECHDEVLGVVCTSTGNYLMRIANDLHAVDEHVILADRRRVYPVSQGEIAVLEAKAMHSRRKAWRELAYQMTEYQREYYRYTHTANAAPDGVTKEELAHWYALAYAYSWLCSGAYYTLKAQVEAKERERT